MKLVEIFESKEKHYATDLHEFDSCHNPELDYYAEEERKRTKKLLKSAKGGTPLVVTDENKQDIKWSNIPQKDQQQTPGFRGAERLKARGELKHKKIQKYDPNAYQQPIEYTNIGTQNINKV